MSRSETLIEENTKSAQSESTILTIRTEILRLSAILAKSEDQLSTLVCKLIGNQPETVSDKPGPQVQGPGQIGELEASVIDLRSEIDKIVETVERLGTSRVV